MGSRRQAVAAYQAAVAAAPAGDPDEVRSKARDGLRRQPDARTAEAYRLSLEGLRHLQRRELTQAADKLARAAAHHPADPYTLYRQALLLVARERRTEALDAFERIVALRPVAPATVLASSCYEAARLLEESGQRERAIEMYRRASRVRGGEAAVRDAAREGARPPRAAQPTAAHPVRAGAPTSPPHGAIAISEPSHRRSRAASPRDAPRCAVARPTEPSSGSRALRADGALVERSAVARSPCAHVEIESACETRCSSATARIASDLVLGFDAIAARAAARAGEDRRRCRWRRRARESTRDGDRGSDGDGGDRARRSRGGDRRARSIAAIGVARSQNHARAITLCLTSVFSQP